VNYLRAKPARALGIFVLAFAVCMPAVVPAVAEGRGGSPRQRGSGEEKGALIVKVKPGASLEGIAAVPDASELGRLDEVGAVVVKVTGRDRGKVRRELARNPAVLSVEDDGEAQAVTVPTDPLWSKQWFARKVNGPKAWEVTTGTKGPIVAVLDTGVQAKHPDLRGRVLPGWNFVANTSVTKDNGDHGTPVAGIIAGAGNNGVGVAGMCWKCRILPVKVLNSTGGGTWSNIAAGIIWAANNGAHVINLSLGGASSTTVLRDAIDYAVSKGVVVIAAAGNSSTTKKFYPAAYPGVISVAGTTSTDKIYNFSNRGSWVRIAAPGCTHTTSVGSTWRSFCGTSAAAPVVAGIAALILSRTPTATKRQVENALLSTAVPIGTVIGGGRVNAAAAIRHLSPSTEAVQPEPTVSPSTAPTATPKPSATPTASPTATPKPSATPTASPKPSATPTSSPSTNIAVEGEVVWANTLDASKMMRTRKVGMRGEAEISVRWYSRHEVKVTLRDSTGRVVATLPTKHWCDSAGCGGTASIKLRLKPDVYRVRVILTDGSLATFRARAAWKDR
jgi:subtilisin family serine protease